MRVKLNRVMEWAGRINECKRYEWKLVKRQKCEGCVISKNGISNSQYDLFSCTCYFFNKLSYISHCLIKYYNYRYIYGHIRQIVLYINTDGDSYNFDYGIITNIGKY